jgi:hypothetical protein
MNKGQFKVGAVNVKVTRKDGSFNLTGKKSPTSIGGAMNCPIVF